MKSPLHHHFRPAPGASKKLLVMIMLLTGLFYVKPAQATHFRYGNITWVRTATANQITFTVSTAWRSGYAWGVPIVVGQVIPASTGQIPFNFGDASGVNLPMTITSVNTVEGWFFATSSITHTYANNAIRTAFFDGCCRVSAGNGGGFLSNNGDLGYRVETVVSFANNNDAPICNVPPIINLPTNVSNASFTITANDPNGDALSYSLSTSAQMCSNTCTNAAQPSGLMQPPGLSINASTGVVTMSTVGKASGTLWSAQIRVTDSKGAVTVQDIFIRIVNQSTAPIFQYAGTPPVTPPNGAVFKIQPGQNLTFTVKASDADAGDVVSLFGVGIPSGATFNPGSAANPKSTTFSWTPTAGQLGYYSLAFTAEDNNLMQSFTNVVIQVAVDPIFQVPPTRIDGTTTYLNPGNVAFDTVVASSPVPSTNVKFSAVSGLPSGATLRSSIPGSFTSVARNSITWTPTVANYGQTWVTFTVLDIINGSETHTLGYFVNSDPSFTSTPVTTGCVSGLYSYDITATDPDLPYGDAIEIVATGLPSWLTLSDNGDGTATLSGTPPAIGTYSITLAVEDLAHHAHAPVEQTFDIHVYGPPSISGCPQTQYQQIYAGANCNQTFTYNPTVTSAISYALSHKFTGATTDSSSGSGSGAAFNTGQTTVTVYATNACGTSSCSFVVTVIDTVKPNVVTKNITVYLDGSGQASISPSDVDNGSSDNCGSVTLSLQNSGTICGQATENQNVYLNAPSGTIITAINFASYGTPTGSCGNYSTSSCHSTISVTKVSQYAIGNNSATIPATNGVFGDPCYGTVKRLYVQATYSGGSTQSNTFDCSKIGNNTVYLNVADVNGNVKSGAATVTVKDTSAPVLTGSIPTGTTGMPLCYANMPAGPSVADIKAQFTDNCNVVNVDKSASVSGNNCSWSVTYTYAIYDNHGNYYAQTPSVTYSGGDNSAPTLNTGASIPSGQTNMTVCKSAAPAGPSEADIKALYGDNCGNVNVSKSGSVTGSDCSWGVTYTYAVTDDCGNQVNPSPTVTYSGGDNSAPTLNSNASIPSGSTGMNVCKSAAPVGPSEADIKALYNDNCGNVNVSKSGSVTGSDCSWSVTYTYTVTDDCGNQVSPSPTVTYSGSDQTAPTASAQNVSVTLSGGTATVSAADVNNGSSDNCGGSVNLSLSKTNFTCADIGNNPVTLTVTDACGNYSTATATVTVNGAKPTCSISVTPSNNTYTGGVPTNIYLGYGPGSVTLTATASGGTSYSYSWTGSYLSSTSSSNTVFTPTAAGSYNILCTVTNNFGCQTTCNVTICVYNIVVPNSGGKVYLCHVPPGNPSNPQTLSISVNAVPSHLGNHSGDKLGSCGMICGQNKTAVVTSDVIIEQDENGMLDLFVSPNPFQNEFTLSYSSYSKETASVLVYDMTGKLVASIAATGYENHLKLGADLANGMYTVRFTQGSTNKVFKVTKAF